MTNEYHGVQVVDDYQWLEDANDPSVKAWSDAQNAAARSVLDSLPDAARVRTSWLKCRYCIMSEINSLLSNLRL